MSPLPCSNQEKNTGGRVQTLPLFLSLLILVLFDTHTPTSFPQFSFSFLSSELLVSGFLRLSSPRCCLEAPGWPRQRRRAPARTRWSRFSYTRSLLCRPLTRVCQLPAPRAPSPEARSFQTCTSPAALDRPPGARCPAGRGGPGRGGARRARAGRPRAFRAGGRRRCPGPAAGAGVARPCAPWRSCGPWGRWAPCGWR